MDSDRFRSAFGRALAKQLSTRNLRIVDLSQKLKRSPSYTSQVMNGSKSASPSLADEIAKALNANEQETVELHTAAALDRGYRVRTDC